MQKVGRDWMFAVQRCKRCGLLKIVELHQKVTRCTRCGHQWLLHPKRRHTRDLCLALAPTLQEAQRKLKELKSRIRT